MPRNDVAGDIKMGERIMSRPGKLEARSRLRPLALLTKTITWVTCFRVAQSTWAFSPPSNYNRLLLPSHCFLFLTWKFIVKDPFMSVRNKGLTCVTMSMSMVAAGKLGHSWQCQYITSFQDWLLHRFIARYFKWNSPITPQHYISYHIFLLPATAKAWPHANRFSFEVFPTNLKSRAT